MHWDGVEIPVPMAGAPPGFVPSSSAPVAYAPAGFAPVALDPQPLEWGPPLAIPRRFLGTTPLTVVLWVVSLLVIVGAGWFTYAFLTKDLDTGLNATRLFAAPEAQAPKRASAPADFPSGVRDPTTTLDANSTAAATTRTV